MRTPILSSDPTAHALDCPCSECVPTEPHPNDCDCRDCIVEDIEASGADIEEQNEE